MTSQTAGEPPHAGQWRLRADGLFTQGRWAEAAAAYEQAIAHDSTDATTWANLGSAHWALGDLEMAAAAYAQSLLVSRESHSILTNYARLLTEMQQFEPALKLLEEVLNRDATRVGAWLAAGNALQLAAEFGQAAEAYRRALDLEPGNAAVHESLALMLIQHGSLAEAERVVQQINASRPNSAECWTLLSQLRQAQIRDSEADAALRQSLAIRPDPVRHSNLLQILQYAENITPQSLLTAHCEWAAAYAAPLYPAAPPPARSAAGRKLRLGFVSADFGRHPIGFLALAPLERLDKSQCEVVCYYDRVAEDDYTARFRTAADAWRVTANWSCGQLAQQVRADGIDILFDMLGHTGRRLLTFAERPAPLQITWAGYVGTTGVTTIDYLLADRFHIRPGEEALYAEQILRMPHAYVCYEGPAFAPEVAPLPALTAAEFMFGCFNNALKYSPRVLAAWAGILQRMPNSRLLLKTRALKQPELRERIHVHFAQHGIGPQRIVLEGDSPRRELLESYGRVDLALDTQPYSGGVTTCEALWMGVPGVTFPGSTFAGRHSTSHLTNAGLKQFVAADLPGYVELAVHWASRREELAIIRAGLREQMRQSPLCDARQFANDFLALLQAAWQRHSAGAPGATSS